MVTEDFSLEIYRLKNSGRPQGNRNVSESLEGFELNFGNPDQWRAEYNFYSMRKNAGSGLRGIDFRSATARNINDFASGESLM